MKHFVAVQQPVAIAVGYAGIGITLVFGEVGGAIGIEIPESAVDRIGGAVISRIKLRGDLPGIGQSIAIGVTGLATGTATTMMSSQPKRNGSRIR